MSAKVVHIKYGPKERQDCLRMLCVDRRVEPRTIDHQGTEQDSTRAHDVLVGLLGVLIEYAPDVETWRTDSPRVGDDDLIWAAPLYVT